jgi:predicted AAA+ superfamily ATPase
MFILETDRFKLKSMKDVDHLNYSINRHFRTIREKVEGEKIMKFFQLLSQHSVKTAGVSFQSNKKMAKDLKTSVRTIQRYISKLESLRIIIKVPTFRKKNNSQTSNTFVILPVLARVCHGGCHTMNPSFKPLKQEKNKLDNIIKNEIKNPSIEKVIQYVTNRVEDAIEKGTTIKFLSSYVDKVFRSIEKQALVEANLAEIEKWQQQYKRSRELLQQGLWERSKNADELDILEIF